MDKKSDTQTKVHRTHEEIMEQFSSRDEYQIQWLDKKTQKLKLAQGEVPVISDWTEIEIRSTQSFWRKFFNSIMLLIYLSVYAIVQFFWNDRGTGYINHAFRGFFFPILPMILVSYRGIGIYIRALIYTGIVGGLSYLAWRRGFITYQGMPLISYFDFLISWFPEALEFFSQETGLNIVRENKGAYIYAAHIAVLAIIYIFEFIILVFRTLFGKNKNKIDMVVTNMTIYVRQESQKSWFATLKVYVKLFINPFNLKQYKVLRDRIQYNREASKEGEDWDYSRFSIEAIKSLKKSNEFSYVIFIIGTILIVAGLLRPILLPGVLVGIFMLCRSFLRKKTFKVRMHIRRSRVEGSWVLSNANNIYTFKKVPPEIATIFQPLKTKRSVQANYTYK